MTISENGSKMNQARFQIESSAPIGPFLRTALESKHHFETSQVNRAYKSEASSIYYESFDRLPTWHSFWFSSWPKIKSDLEQIWCHGSADSENCQVFLGSFSKGEFHRSHDDSRLSFLRDENLIPGQYPEIAVIMRDFEDWQQSRNIIIRPEAGSAGSDNKESTDENRKHRTRLSEFGHAKPGLQPENKASFQIHAIRAT